MIKHIWFDLAGTLYKETPQFNQAHDNVRYQTYAKLKGITDPKQAKEEFLAIYHKYGSNSAVFTALGQPSSYWMKALDNFDFAAVLKPDPEVSQTIAQLKDEVPLSLFTNFVRYRLDGLLNYLEIPPTSFTHILSGDDVTERKPALEGFRKIISVTGLPADQILYVGDRVAADIEPAKKVGLKTCLVYDKSVEADFSVKGFKDLLELI